MLRPGNAQGSRDASPEPPDARAAMFSAMLVLSRGAPAGGGGRAGLLAPIADPSVASPPPLRFDSHLGLDWCAAQLHFSRVGGHVCAFMSTLNTRIKLSMFITVTG